MSSPFASAFLAGFECSTQRRGDGRRLDLSVSTGHARFAASDYAALAAHGIRAARDGLRWHLIEAFPGTYDWSGLVPVARAARAAGVQVAWDLCHYGWPDHLDIWSPEFPGRFARLAAGAARVLAQESGAPPVLCPINEMSFWAWAGGDAGRIGPLATGRGPELKRQLARACIAGIRAAREAVPGTRFLHAEPAINVASGPDPEHRRAAAAWTEAQYEALDIVSGRLEPELGGGPDCLDVVGVNYYPDNQWYIGGSTIPLGHHAYRPFREILAEAHARYGRPLLVSETGAEGSARAAWLHYVCDEVLAAREAGVPVLGICLYPILDYPGWDDDRPCAVGLFSTPAPDGTRTVHAGLAAEIARQRPGLERALRPGLAGAPQGGAADAA